MGKAKAFGFAQGDDARGAQAPPVLDGGYSRSAPINLERTGQRHGVGGSLPRSDMGPRGAKLVWLVGMAFVRQVLPVPVPVHTCLGKAPEVTEGDFSVPDSCMRGAYYKDGLTCKLVPQALWGESCPGWTPCTPGYFCASDGIRRPCPPGRFGASTKLLTEFCDGICPSGHFCPETSVTPQSCGAIDRFCPEGSVTPTIVDPGYYTIGNESSNHRTGQQLCEPGMYCDGSGIKQLCPAGRYGATAGLPGSQCSGECEPGWYCPAGSTSPKQIPCGNTTVYCPAGSGVPAPTRKGWYAIRTYEHDPATQFFSKAGFDSQTPCEVGTYCQNGIRSLCAAGRYGARKEEHESICTGTCRMGYYCPPGSHMATQNVCGNSTVYCPRGSSLPTPVKDGFYTYSSVGAKFQSRPFIQVDVNGDGFLTYIEFSSEMTGALNDVPTDNEIQILWKLADEDTSGELDIREYQLVLDVVEPYGVVDIYLARECLTNVTMQGSINRRSRTVKDICQQARIRDVNRTDMLERTAHHDGDLTSRHIRTHYGDRHRDIERVETRTAETICEPGYFCVDGIRHQCPRGLYGVRSGETSPSCTAPCAAGYYCPAKSTNATPIPCGDHSLFCPTGSHYPQPVQTGYYTLGNSDDEIPIQKVNPLYSPHPGTDPIEGDPVSPTPSPTTKEIHVRRRLLSSDSTHTSTTVNTTLRTDYTPTIEEFALARSREKKCPPGSWCQEGLKYNCPPGRYGDSYGMVDPLCTGPCAAGYICPTASTSPEEIPCGDPQYYCLEGAFERTKVALGYYTIDGGTTTRRSEAKAPRGHYSSRGLLYECPAGRYGATTGLTSSECTGPCAAGYYCPPASVAPRQRACGGPDLICPPKSSFPLVVSEGYYTSTTVVDECPPGMYRNVSEVFDPSLRAATNPQGVVPASWVVTVAHEGSAAAAATPSEGRLDPRETRPLGPHDGEGYGDLWAIGPQAPCVRCPEGTYKAQQGDGEDLCLPCDMTVSVSSEDRTTCECWRRPGGESWEALQFLASRGTCVAVDIENATMFEPPKTLTNSTWTRHKQWECERGYACTAGVRFVCPAGRFGASTRNTNLSCTGICAAGYYCPEGSTSPTQIPCGGADRYCPEGSAVPIFVSKYHYTEEIRAPEIRTYETLCPLGHYCTDGLKYECPAGRYGNSHYEDDEDCSGPCSPGFYCPTASTSPEPIRCGNASVYCPTGSVLPTSVLPGFYSIHTGEYSGLLDLNDPLNETMSAQLLCEPGHWCRDGIKVQCQAGRYGWSYGLSTPECSGECSPGFYCPSYPYPGSVKAEQVECGGSDLYCPPGTGNNPLIVSSGYYTTGGGADGKTRSGQRACEPGTYCEKGETHPCPSGTYGKSYKMKNSACSGFCPPGFFCPEATVIPQRCQAGTYSVGGNSKCSVCPGGKDYSQGQSCVDARKCCGY